MVFDGILISVIVGLFRRGSFKGLANLELKWGWIFPLLLLIQLVVYFFQNKVTVLGDISELIYMTIYIVGMIFLYVNRKNSGFSIILIGVFLNFLVMFLNGGRMPVSEEAAAVLDPMYINALKEGLYAKHTLLVESTKLGFLGDIIPLSSPYPKSQIISIGDVIMNIGGFQFIQHIMVSKKKEQSVELSHQL